MSKPKLQGREHFVLLFCRFLGYLAAPSQLQAVYENSFGSFGNDLQEVGGGCEDWMELA